MTLPEIFVVIDEGKAEVWSPAALAALDERRAMMTWAERLEEGI